MSKITSSPNVSAKKNEKPSFEWGPESRVEMEKFPVYSDMSRYKLGGGLNIKGQIGDLFHLVLGAGLSYVGGRANFSLYRDASGFCESRNNSDYTMGLDFSQCPGFRSSWLNNEREIEYYELDLTFEGIAAYLKLGSEISFYSQNKTALFIPIFLVLEGGQVSVDKIDYEFSMATTSLELGLGVNVKGKLFDFGARGLFSLGQTHWVNENLFKYGMTIEYTLTPHVRKLKALNETMSQAYEKAIQEIE